MDREHPAVGVRRPQHHGAEARRAVRPDARQHRRPPRGIAPAGGFREPGQQVPDQVVQAVRRVAGHARCPEIARRWNSQAATQANRIMPAIAPWSWSFCSRPTMIVKTAPQAICANPINPEAAPAPRGLTLTAPAMPFGWLMPLPIATTIIGMNTVAVVTTPLSRVPTLATPPIIETPTPIGIIRSTPSRDRQ